MRTELTVTINLIDQIYSKGKNYLSSYNNYAFDNIEKLLAILVLERILGNLNSIKHLLTIIEENPNIEPSIGLILRNNLNLCKIVFKYSELSDNKENHSKFLGRIFGENIQQTLKRLQKQNSIKEIEPFLENIKKKYSFILNKTGITLENIENTRFDYNLNLSSQFESLENLIQAFSKYEHFGLNTLILQDSNNFEEIFSRINISIHYSLQGILICLVMLDITDDELMLINKSLAKI